MTPQTILLALLVFALIASRPFEEGRWRDGRLSDRGAAILVVGRLPFLALGFALITRREPAVMLGMTAIALALAALLYPLVVGRLRRTAAQRGNGARGPGKGPGSGPR